MSGGRWKHRTEKVTVDENTVTVRGLTAGEREQFSEASKQVAENKIPGAKLTEMVAKFGVVDPQLADEDLRDMPGVLLEEAVTKILVLSGLRTEKKAEPPEG